MCTPAAHCEAGGGGIDGATAVREVSGENTIQLSRKQEKRWLSRARECPTPYDNYNALLAGFCPGMRPVTESAADFEALTVGFAVAWQSHSHRMV